MKSMHLTFAMTVAVAAGVAFTEVATGHVETRVLFDRLAANSAGANAIAATYAGFTNFTYAGPTLVVMAAAVPEPSTYLMLLAGAGVLVVAGRRR